MRRRFFFLRFFLKKILNISCILIYPFSMDNYRKKKKQQKDPHFVKHASIQTMPFSSVTPRKIPLHVPVTAHAESEILLLPSLSSSPSCILLPVKYICQKVVGTTGHSLQIPKQYRRFFSINIQYTNRKTTTLLPFSLVVLR